LDVGGPGCGKNQTLADAVVEGIQQKEGELNKEAILARRFKADGKCVVIAGDWMG
jgi:hypothetical protein